MEEQNLNQDSAEQSVDQSAPVEVPQTSIEQPEPAQPINMGAPAPMETPVEAPSEVPASEPSESPVGLNWKKPIITILIIGVIGIILMFLSKTL